jgi:hypothetical protein
MSKSTQTDVLVRFLRSNPGASSLEITMACGIVNVTGRVSDARDAGHHVECKRGKDGRFRYFLVEEPVQLGWAS